MSHITPQIIRSPDKMLCFLSGEKEAKQIIKNAKRKDLGKDRLFYSRWEVTKICMQVPLHFIQECFFRTFAICVKIIGLQSLSKRCMVHAAHKNARFSQLLLQMRHGTHFLAPLRNLHDRQTHSFYTKSNLPRSLAKENPFLTGLKSNTFPKDKLEFFQKQGLCNGAVHWLLYLYHLTKEKTENPIAHMRALILPFQKGFSIQAAFLQNFLWSPHLKIEKGALKMKPSTQTQKFLGVRLRQSPGIEIIEEGGSIAEIQPPSSTTQSRELSRQPNPQEFLSLGTRSKNSKKASQELCKLDCGTYGITIKTLSGAHRLAYIKLNEKLAFLIDPYFGLFRFTGKNHGHQIFDFFARYPWWKTFSNIKNVRFDHVDLKTFSG